MDLVARSPRLPIPGETILGHDFFTAPGGKGANQAVAVARLGIPTQLVGRVGNDNFGRSLLANLQSFGVQTEHIFIDENTSSGVAVITVDDAGQNNIIVIPGANGLIDETDVQRLKSLFDGAAALLLQWEIPLTMVELAASSAQKVGVKVILDPAPTNLDAPDDFYSRIDIITPNEIEASQLVGFEVNNYETASQAASVLLHKGVKTAIIKLGAKGVCCATTESTFFVPAFPVQTVDTVAAGDAFNGGLVAAITQGLDLREAVVWGAAAGAISTTKAGAMSSMCDRQTLDTFLKERNFSSDN